ncbi:MAG: AAA family ATPase [Tuberibacillus sp.]
MTLGAKRSIYIFSGPCGVGKSTITKAFAGKLGKAVLIEGDEIHSMLPEDADIPWETGLSIVWKNLVSLTKNFHEGGLDVIIDFVVEEELAWFCRQFSEDISIYYIVLRADAETLIKRINARGDHYIIDRSLFLLNKLEASSQNQPYLFDTTDKDPASIIKNLISHIDRYQVVSNE